jgi:hypothetical protein
MMRHASQLDFQLTMPVRWGGAREGAGRKPATRARVLHRSRAAFPARNPGLVTIRVRRDVPSLRIVKAVEAAGNGALARGMKSAAARIARAVNHVHGRRGAVFDGRFHHRELATPKEVRSALAYVLLNSRKHAAARGVDPGSWQMDCDPASSGRWFAGWNREAAPAMDAPAVASPRTWLLAHGLAVSWAHPRGRDSGPLVGDSTLAEARRW